jgi:hypothetical protein
MRICAPFIAVLLSYRDERAAAPHLTKKAGCPSLDFQTWETTNLAPPSLFGPAAPKARFAENYPPGMHTANRAKFLRSAGP